jgi:RNA polymerase sigma-70 factor (ECF subfamily)
MAIATVPSLRGEALAQEFEEIFREHGQFVYRTAYSVTGNRPDAEDVLQTIFLKLLRRELPPNFRTNPKAYLYRAAVNLALNSVRSRKYLSPMDDSDGIEAPAASPVLEADEALQRLLTAAIAQLKPRAVEILVLRYAHNYSDAQIAKMLGKSRGTVAVTLYRARARLKKLMQAGETL